MKILVQADGIQLTPENDFDEQRLAALEGPCELYRIAAGHSLGMDTLDKPATPIFTGSYRLVKGEKDEGPTSWQAWPP